MTKCTGIWDCQNFAPVLYSSLRQYGWQIQSLFQSLPTHWRVVPCRHTSERANDKPRLAFRYHKLIFPKRCLRKIAQYLRHDCLPGWPYGTTLFPLEGFLRNLTCEDFYKICPEDRVWTTHDKDDRCCTCRPVSGYGYILPNCFLNEKCFWQKMYRKSKHILRSIFFFSKIVSFMR